MSVRALDNNGDWTFGRGRANYAKNSQEISQNLITRLRSIKSDWFLDVQAEIDWFSILGNRENEKTIIREVERVTLATSGVKSIESLSISGLKNRKATINMIYTDIFDRTFSERIGVEI